MAAAKVAFQFVGYTYLLETIFTKKLLVFCFLLPILNWIFLFFNRLKNLPIRRVPVNAENDTNIAMQRFNFASAQAFGADIPPDLDPRLQWMMARHQAGEVFYATASTSNNEISVIAKVNDPRQWEQLSEVRAPVIIGEQQGGMIVTGKIPVGRIAAVRNQSFVVSMKAARELFSHLDKTTEDTKAKPTLLPSGNKTNGGAGVIVGVIDYGCDFAHENFRNDNGTSRLLFLWDQNGVADSNSPHGYGREYDQATINHALQTQNPYQTLRYDPSDYEDPDDPGAHGTHVTDIAAGNGRGTLVPGMAPKASLIFVNLSHQRDPVGTAVVGKTFGDSVTLLEAANYIFDKAGDTPCVINISLGTNGGPHDGTTLVEEGFDALLAAKPNRAIVLAAGNAFDDGIHQKGTVSANGTVDLRWMVSKRPKRDIEMEVWYPASDRFLVELIDPAGVVRASVPAGQNQTLAIGHKVVFVANRIKDPNNGDNMINVFLASGIDPGIYTIRLQGTQVVKGHFHAWIERDNSSASQFDAPKDGSYTIGTVSCGKSTIAVGSYDAHKTSLPLSWFSSAGPTRDGRHKPEVSAPGHEVLAALSGSGKDPSRMSGKGSRRMSGTSMASPAVAGMLALVYAEAKQRGFDISIDLTRYILAQTGRQIDDNHWHPQLGWGRVDAHAAVQKLIALASAASAAADIAAADNAKAAELVGKQLE